MLQNLISNDLYLTLIGQFASFCGLLVCLTISMYGGNEHGKLPETYTYEQFLEYRRAHGTDQTKKKLQEVEAKRLEKAAQNKKNGGGQTKHAGAGGGKHLSKNQISTTTKKQSLEDNKTKKEKQPTKLLDKLGFSSRSKKTKKKDALAQSDRPKKIKHHSFDADETFIDEPIMRKAASPTGGGEHGGPLVALPEGGHFDNKSHTGSSTTTSPTGSTNKSPITKSPVTSVFFNLDDASGKKPKRLKDRILSNPAAAAQNEFGATKEAVTAKESRTSKEHKHLQPVTPPLSPKPKSDDDEFTPTVFELINAPVKPVTEKRKKARKMSELGHNKHPAALTVKESKKKISQPLEEDKTIEDDIAVDMEEDVKPKPKDLKKVKEKLKEKHQKMIERQKKIEKKKTEMELQKKLSKDSKKPSDAATDRATANATSKKKQKRKSSNKKDKAIASKPTDKKVSETTAKSSTGIGNVPEVDAKSPINSKTPTDSKDSDFNGDKTSKELTAEECDKTEEDEEIFTAKDEKLVRGIELRKIQSAKRFVERPPEKLKITASARIFGHRCENPRTQKATLKAIEKIKKTQKSSMPHKSATVSKSKSSTSPSSSTGPTRSATTTWSSTSKSSTSLTSTSPSSSPGPTASATTTWSSTTCSEGGHK